jgi:hypothetical protein
MQYNVLTGNDTYLCPAVNKQRHRRASSNEEKVKMLLPSCRITRGLKSYKRKSQVVSILLPDIQWRYVRISRDWGVYFAWNIRP